MLTIVEVNDQRFYKDEKNNLLPSASSVIDILFPMNKDFIPEEALEMGKLCHAEVSKALVTEIVNKQIYQVHPDPKVAPRVAAALEWLTKLHMDILAVESPTHYLGVGMTPDLLLGGFPLNSQPCYHVVDWKFAESVAERYLYQAEFYMRAEGAETATIVRIDRKANVYPVRVLKDDERWEKIKSAINVRHHLNRNMKRYV